MLVVLSAGTGSCQATSMRDAHRRGGQRTQHLHCRPSGICGSVHRPRRSTPHASRLPCLGHQAPDAGPAANEAPGACGGANTPPGPQQRVPGTPPGRRSACRTKGGDMAQRQAFRQMPDWVDISVGWLGRQDSNLGMAVPKTAALPLGYAPAMPRSAGHWIGPGPRLVKPLARIIVPDATPRRPATSHPAGRAPPPPPPPP